MSYYSGLSPVVPTTSEIAFPNPSPAKARSDKKGKPKHQKSALIDAEILKRLKASRKAAASSSVVETIVSKSVSVPSPTPSLTPNGPTTVRLATRKVPAFRDVGDEVHAHAFHEALTKRGAVIAFTVDLDWEVIDRAYLEPSFLDYVRRAVRREIREAFGPVIQWWFALEEVWDADLQRHRPHIHGEIVIAGLSAVVSDPLLYRLTKHRSGFRWSDPALARKLSRGLRRGGGEWPVGRRQFQVELVPDADWQWPSYATKDAWRARPGMRRLMASMSAGRRYELSFAGKVLTATGALKSEAEAIYDSLIR